MTGQYFEKHKKYLVVDCGILLAEFEELENAVDFLKKGGVSRSATIKENPNWGQYK